MWNTDFVLFYQMQIHNPVKQITWSVLKKNSQLLNTVNYFLAKSSILDVSLGSEYVFDCPEAFSIIINWDFHFESFRIFSYLFSILLVSGIWSRHFGLRVRSSRSQMSFKISVLKSFAIFTGKKLHWSLFLIKL